MKKLSKNLILYVVFFLMMVIQNANANMFNKLIFNLKNSKFFKLFFAIILLVVVSFNVMLFFNDDKRLPATPLSVPIDISQKGNKAEIDIRIETKEEKSHLEPESTAFDLQFLYYDPRNDKDSKYYIGFLKKNLIMIGYSKPEYTKEEISEIGQDRHRVLSFLEHEELISSGIGVSYKSKWIKHQGVSIPSLRLRIIDLNDLDKKVVFDEVLDVKKHPEIGDYFYKYLTCVNLKPGNYKIIAEVQSDAFEFKGTKVLIVIGSYRAKV